MDKNTIYNLISSNQIEEALRNLITICANFDKALNNQKRNLVIISSKYNELKNKKIIGSLTTEDENVLTSQVLESLLNITDEIFNTIDPTVDKSIGGNKQDHLVFDSKNFILYDNKITLGTIGTQLHDYNTRSIFDEDKNITWELYAKHIEYLGLNIFFSEIKGTIEFEYCPLGFNETKDNLIFFIIPMKSNDSVIEVGANVRRDPKNEHSPFRIRKLPKPVLNNWFAEKMDFDFTDTPDAKEAVFAPRINEGCPRPGNGRLQIRNVKIYSRG